jgi:hypothetical protein
MRWALPVLVATFSLFAGHTAGAQTLRADLDGDGIRDEILGGALPTDLSIRLSSTAELPTLHLVQRILRITTADVDHDGDRDIIATTESPGFDIFLNQGNGRFQAVHAAPVLRWGTYAAHLDQSPSGPGTDNPSDTPSGAVPVQRRSLRTRTPTPLFRCLSPFAVLPLLSRVIDPRGPPSPRA